MGYIKVFTQRSSDQIILTISFETDELKINETSIPNIKKSAQYNNLQRQYAFLDPHF